MAVGIAPVVLWKDPEVLQMTCRHWPKNISLQEVQEK